MRLIDADELKKVIHSSSLSGNREWLLMDLDQIIDNAPTVKAKTTKDCIMAYGDGYETARRLYERPQGEWGEPFSHGDRLYHKCSNCHLSTQIIFDNYFCPNCGADMRGEKDV